LNIIAWIIVGLVAGLIAKALVPGDEPGGIIFTTLLGIVGSIVGGFISVALGLGNGIDDFDIGTLVLAILGSVLILFVYNMVVGGTRGSRI
jgi:uncharacterized membrane protein YeaQ/YmgE (transglycosylase-associated protein family)